MTSAQCWFEILYKHAFGTKWSQKNGLHALVTLMLNLLRETCGQGSSDTNSKPVKNAVLKDKIYNSNNIYAGQIDKGPTSYMRHTLDMRNGSSHCDVRFEALILGFCPVLNHLFTTKQAAVFNR